jgi:hypothetical protein
LELELSTLQVEYLFCCNKEHLKVNVYKADVSFGIEFCIRSKGLSISFEDSKCIGSEKTT